MMLSLGSSLLGGVGEWGGWPLQWLAQESGQGQGAPLIPLKSCCKKSCLLLYSRVQEGIFPSPGADQPYSFPVPFCFTIQQRGTSHRLPQLPLLSSCLDKHVFCSWCFVPDKQVNISLMLGLMRESLSF